MVFHYVVHINCGPVDEDSERTTDMPRDPAAGLARKLRGGRRFDSIRNRGQMYA